jgi:hypothetical protein
VLLSELAIPTALTGSGLFSDVGPRTSNQESAFWAFLGADPTDPATIWIFDQDTANSVGLQELEKAIAPPFTIRKYGQKYE